MYGSGILCSLMGFVVKEPNWSLIYIYIYIKPKLLKLPHFSTSALFKKLKLLKKYKKNKTIKIITLYSVTISNPITISPQNKPDKTYVSVSVSPSNANSANKHCKTHTQEPKNGKARRRSFFLPLRR